MTNELLVEIERLKETIANLHSECHAHAEQHAGDEAKIDAMQPVVDAAVAWRAVDPEADGEADDLQRVCEALDAAVDTYLKGAGK